MTQEAPGSAQSHDFVAPHFHHPLAAVSGVQCCRLWMGCSPSCRRTQRRTSRHCTSEASQPRNLAPSSKATYSSHLGTHDSVLFRILPASAHRVLELVIQCRNHQVSLGLGHVPAGVSSCLLTGSHSVSTRVLDVVASIGAALFQSKCVSARHTVENRAFLLWLID